MRPSSVLAYNRPSGPMRAQVKPMPAVFGSGTGVDATDESTEPPSVPVVKLIVNGASVAPLTSFTPVVQTKVYLVFASSSPKGVRTIASPPPVVLTDAGISL